MSDLPFRHRLITNCRDFAASPNVRKLTPAISRSFRPETLVYRIALMLLLIAPAPLCIAADAITVSDLWIRETPPGQTVASGYLSLTNTGTSARFLLGAESAQAQIELHTIMHADDMMRMRPLSHFEIPAGSTRALAPGGAHLMLFGVDATRAGMTIELELLFDDGSRLPVALPIRKKAP